MDGPLLALALPNLGMIPAASPNASLISCTQQLQVDAKYLLGSLIASIDLGCIQSRNAFKIGGSPCK